MDPGQQSAVNMAAITSQMGFQNGGGGSGGEFSQPWYRSFLPFGSAIPNMGLANIASMGSNLIAHKNDFSRRKLMAGLFNSRMSKPISPADLAPDAKGFMKSQGMS
jgi:hypothetical protein